MGSFVVGVWICSVFPPLSPALRYFGSGPSLEAAKHAAVNECFAAGHVVCTVKRCGEERD